MATESLMSPISGVAAYSIYADGGALSTPIGADPTVYSGAYFSSSNSSSITAYVEYSFDLSAIPAEAEIDSVSCLAGGWVQTSYYSKYVANLYSGSTAKGNEGSLYSGTTNFTVTIDGGAWTRDELKDCRIRFTGQKKTSGIARCYVNGARITVQYTYKSEKFMLKLEGTYNDIARTFKKVNGIWVEQTELSSVVEDGVRYKNGGEYVSPQKTVTITGNGTTFDGNFCSGVQIGDVQYKSPAVVQVETGTTIKVTTYQLPIYLNGVLVAEHTMFTEYNHVVNSDCTVLLSVDTLSGGDGVVNITT